MTPASLWFSLAVVTLLFVLIFMVIGDDNDASGSH